MSTNARQDVVEHKLGDILLALPCHAFTRAIFYAARSEHGLVVVSLVDDLGVGGRIERADGKGFYQAQKALEEFAAGEHDKALKRLSKTFGHVERREVRGARM